MVIALDFDGTMVTHDYPIVGRELPEVVNVLTELLESGCKFVLNTMRSDGRQDGKGIILLWLSGFNNPHVTKHYTAIIDYLRSAGYNMVFGQYSPAQLIEMGVVSK